MNDNVELEDIKKHYFEMLKALLAVEWVEYGRRPYCPWCDNYRDDGHKADCQRQAALGLNVEA